MARKKNSGSDDIVNFVFSILKMLFSALGSSRPASANSSRQSNAGRQASATAMSQSVRFEPSHVWDSKGDFEFDVVGESFYQDNLRKFAGVHGDEPANEEVDAYIVPDNDNEYDDKAVAIYVNGHKVAHMSRTDARKFRRRLSSKKLGGATTQCKAIITGGGLQKRSGQRYDYGISLDIKPFAD